MIEIPQWAESRTFKALFHKYSATQWNREFQDAEVRRIVCGLSLIVRLWSFGYDTWATDAATLLDRAEPLEALTMDSLEVAKMRIFHLAYSKQFDAAQIALVETISQFGEDALLCRMGIWLDELKGKC